MISVALVAITWTQAEIDQLKAAIASGVLSVSYSGPPSRTITYQSLDAMRAALAEMNASVNASSGSNGGYRLAASRKGL